jgi:hypothetical protein
MRLSVLVSWLVLTDATHKEMVPHKQMLPHFEKDAARFHEEMTEPPPSKTKDYIPKWAKKKGPHVVGNPTLSPTPAATKIRVCTSLMASGLKSGAGKHAMGLYLVQADTYASKPVYRTISVGSGPAFVLFWNSGDWAVGHKIGTPPYILAGSS